MLVVTDVLCGCCGRPSGRRRGQAWSQTNREPISQEKKNSNFFYVLKGIQDGAGMKR